MAAFGWQGQDQAALEDACRDAGVNLVADNLREHAAGLHTAKGSMDKRGSKVKVKHIAEDSRGSEN